ncbi:glutaredoxin family protein [Trichothermofontia sichuanensis B231]|uniref:glutaredoxin family protein n=1 Tax=Trichothermofontia sichuanensis TaxID=3045816 RepID=UPI0022454B62|nr:glutaredoxin family protein [Trichothermofontia sichuanensis]UZQ55688.1 glutaredoxin family protein [Trichothermofontia sichuanensis B231]
MRLIMYAKPGCHICAGLKEKLAQITTLDFELEVRDITTRQDWLETYEMSVPVLYLIPDENIGEAGAISIPRLSPRASVDQLTQMLQKVFAAHA